MLRNTLQKTERLCSETAIEELFAQGKKFHSFPLLIVARKREDTDAARILISVSKKRFHNAVDRNRVKRLIRAAYRQNKFPDGYDVAFIYISNKIEEYSKIEQAVKQVNSE
ncbi:MAG: ribonuclease P protein component [Paludibacteraceae bacterium]|nr:ribonuclease P protein component [Paludibacteraceae bacterium]